METKKVLIFEDNLYALSALLKALGDFEQELMVKYGVDIAVTIFSTSQDSKHLPDIEFDVIILDHDDKVGESFHNLDWDIINVETVIVTSTIPEWNHMLVRKGATHIVRKDYLDLAAWSKEVVTHVKNIATH